MAAFLTTADSRSRNDRVADPLGGYGELSSAAACDLISSSVYR